MQKFDNGGQFDVVVALKAKGLTAQQDQHGPQALAAAFHDVVADFFNHGNI